MCNNIKSMKKNHDFKLFSSCCVIMMLLNYIMMKVVKDHCIKLDLTYINYVQLHIQLFGYGWKLRELTQPRRRRQQERHKFAYLIVKNNSFARFARAVFIFDISQKFSFFLRREMTCFAVVWTTWPYDDISLRRWFQFNSRIVGTHFARVFTLNN